MQLELVRFSKRRNQISQRTSNCDFQRPKFSVTHTAKHAFPTKSTRFSSEKGRICRACPIFAARVYLFMSYSRYPPTPASLPPTFGILTAFFQASRATLAFEVTKIDSTFSRFVARKTSPFNLIAVLVYTPPPYTLSPAIRRRTLRALRADQTKTTQPPLRVPHIGSTPRLPSPFFYSLLSEAIWDKTIQYTILIYYFQFSPPPRVSSIARYYSTIFFTPPRPLNAGGVYLFPEDVTFHSRSFGFGHFFFFFLVWSTAASIYRNCRGLIIMLARLIKISRFCVQTKSLVLKVRITKKKKKRSPRDGLPFQRGN